MTIAAINFSDSHLLTDVPNLVLDSEHAIVGEKAIFSLVNTEVPSICKPLVSWDKLSPIESSAYEQIPQI